MIHIAHSDTATSARDARCDVAWRSENGLGLIDSGDALRRVKVADGERVHLLALVESHKHVVALNRAVG